MAEFVSIIDGHEQKSPFLMNEFKDAAFKRGMGIRHIKQIDQCDIVNGNLDKIITDFAVMRGTPKGSTVVDNVMIAEWARCNKKTIMNINSLGGVASVSCDKVLEQYIFGLKSTISKHNIHTYDANTVDNIIRIMNIGVLKYPFLLKPKNGSLGKGIRLVENEEDITSGGENLWNMLVQNYIPSRCDWRVYVVGGVAVGIIKKGEKESLRNDFQAYATGITIEEEADTVLREKLAKLAIEMTASFGLEYSGCDITQDKDTGELYALEVNNSPAWVSQYTEIMGRTVADFIIEWIYDRKTTKRKTVYDKIKNYVPKRMMYVNRKKRKIFEDILNWDDSSVVKNSNDLTDRLREAYMMMKELDKKCTNARKHEILTHVKYMISEIERTPLCWAGDFIGSNMHGEDGNMENGCIPSAYYLAICEKYDKIMGVN